MRALIPWLFVSCLAIACGDPAPAAPPPEARAAEEQLAALARTPPAGTEAQVAAPRVEALQLFGHGEGSVRVRAVIHLQGEPPFRRRELRTSAGGRAVAISFEECGLGASVPELVEVNRAGLVRIGAERDDAGATLTFELAPEARYELYLLDAPRRLVMDVERVAPAVRSAAPLVLIDPGHGGEDLGSPGPHGLWEGKLTLDIARRLRSWLLHLAPGVRVRMTRDSDVYITLEERAAMANALSAALFVSVHLNAATTTVDHGGVATYVLDVSNDRNVLRLAARENGTSTTQVSPLQYLVGSLAREEQRAASEELASLVQRGTLASARRFLPTLADRGVKSAMFYVLVGAQMPAVLVEGSFITQPDEAAQLATDAYRDALAEGIARGIAKYLAAK